MKKLLKTLIFGLIAVPTIANAAVDKAEYNYDLPLAGATPDTTLSYKFTEEGKEDITGEKNIVWYETKGEGEPIALGAEDKFKAKTNYTFDLAPGQEPINLEKDDETIMIVNGQPLEGSENPIINTYRVKAIEFVVTEPVVGEKPSKTATYIVVSEDVNGDVKENIELDVIWGVLNGNEMIPMEDGDTFEEGKTYVVTANPMIQSEEMEKLLDVMNNYLLPDAIMSCNGKEIGDNIPSFGPLTSQTEIIPPTGGIKDEEENPNTFDGVKTSIFVGTLSIIGLIGASLYIKKALK